MISKQSNKISKFAKLQEDFANYYKEDTRKLINHLRSSGYSDHTIAKLLGKNQSVISRSFPRRKEVVNEPTTKNV